ncbi:probable calcium-binding protein CML13 isoform X1 [Cicer arietinum]
MLSRGDSSRINDKSKKRQLTRQKKLEIVEAFEIYNYNKSSTIDAEDMMRAMRTLGFDMTKEEIDEMIIKMDTNNNGIIEFHEFEDLVTIKIGERDIKEKLKKAFNFIDKDKMKKIRATDVEVYAEMLWHNFNFTIEEISQMIVEAPKINGVLDVNDFISLMNKIEFRY